MYLKDGIVYGEDVSKPIKVESVKVLANRMMIVTFISGETRLFDTTTLTGPAFKPLEDPEVFNNPVIDHGVIYLGRWGNRHSSRSCISKKLFLL